MLTEAIRLIITLAMAVGSVFIANNYPPAYVPRDYALIILIIIGTGLGYVIGGETGRRFSRLNQWLVEKSKKFSSQELLVGVAGLVVGLVVAALISKPIDSILSEVKYLIPYIMTFLYLFLGYLGFSLFVNRPISLVNLENETSVDFASNVLDTSAIIDGRIAAVLRAGFLQGNIIIPRFVLGELQTIADSSDDIRRAKGRRGLDILKDIRKLSHINLEIIDVDFPSLLEVDDKLVMLCKEKKANLVTNDFNLGKVATLEGVHILNLNELSVALKPVVLPGEEMSLHLSKVGKEKDQGVGYLEDGTMIVVQHGSEFVGKDIKIIITSIIQTSAGKLIFARPK